MGTTNRVCERCGFPAQHLRPTRRIGGRGAVWACEDCSLDLECELAHANGTYCPKHGAPLSADRTGAA